MASRIRTLRTESVTIDVTDTLVLAAHPRNTLILTNSDAADNVFIHFGTAAATVANGHKLAPSEHMILSEVHHEGEVRAIKDGTGTGVLIVTHYEDV